MGVNRLNPVQKATYFFKKPKVGKNEECTVTVKYRMIADVKTTAYLQYQAVGLIHSNPRHFQARIFEKTCSNRQEILCQRRPPCP